MTVLKKFGENGQEVGSENVQITDQNFSEYIKQNGIDRAKGYHDCLADIMKEIDVILYFRDTSPGYCLNSDAKIRRHMDMLFINKTSVIKALQSKIEQADPSISDNNTNLTI